MNAQTRILDWPADPDDLLPMALWDAASVAAATGGSASGDFQVAGVEIDSRDVVSGDLFFALKGEKMDGHRFAAAGVVAEKESDGSRASYSERQNSLLSRRRAARCP